MVNKDKQYYIPMETSIEFALAHGYTREDFKYWRIGNRVVRGILIEVTEEQYYEYMRPIWREYKREDRKKEYFEEHDITVVSIERMQDEFEYECADDFDLENEVHKRILLEQLKGKLALLEELDQVIMQRWMEGKTEREIADEIGKCQKTVNKRKLKVIEYLKQIFLK